jgi:hypothetical protein
MRDYMGMNIPEVLGKVYPNGEFVVWKPRVVYEDPLKGMPTVPGVVDYVGTLVDMEFPEGQYMEETVTPLGLSLDPILNLPSDGGFELRARKGLQGITAHGRRMLRNGCFIATLTLPSLSMEQGLVVQSRWSEVMQNFKNAFAKLCKKNGLPLKYCYCVEIQEKRSKREGWPVLHVHMVFPGRRSARGAWRITTSSFDAIWKAALERVLCEHVDVSSACNMQQVERSAEAYISKYLSKGANSIESWNSDDREAFFPHHWWGMSNELRARIRSGVYYGERIGKDLEYYLKDKDSVVFSRRIEIEYQGAKYQVGIYGKLHSNVREEAMATWDKVDEIPF